MSFGLTSDGFVRKRLQDILDSLRTNTESVLGPIDMSDTGVFGKVYGVAAEQMAQLWEEIGAILLGLYPASAEGVQLDSPGRRPGESGKALRKPQRGALDASCSATRALEIATDDCSIRASKARPVGA